MSSQHLDIANQAGLSRHVVADKIRVPKSGGVFLSLLAGNDKQDSLIKCLDSSVILPLCTELHLI